MSFVSRLRGGPQGPTECFLQCRHVVDFQAYGQGDDLLAEVLGQAHGVFFRGDELRAEEFRLALQPGHQGLGERLVIFQCFAARQRCAKAL